MLWLYCSSVHKSSRISSFIKCRFWFTSIHWILSILLSGVSALMSVQNEVGNFRVLFKMWVPTVTPFVLITYSKTTIPGSVHFILPLWCSQRTARLAPTVVYPFQKKDVCLRPCWERERSKSRCLTLWFIKSGKERDLLSHLKLVGL